MSHKSITRQVFNGLSSPKYHIKCVLKDICIQAHVNKILAINSPHFKTGSEIIANQHYNFEIITKLFCASHDRNFNSRCDKQKN